MAVNYAPIIDAVVLCAISLPLNLDELPIPEQPPSTTMVSSIHSGRCDALQVVSSSDFSGIDHITTSCVAVIWGGWELSQPLKRPTLRETTLIGFKRSYGVYFARRFSSGRVRLALARDGRAILPRRRGQDMEKLAGLRLAPYKGLGREAVQPELSLELRLREVEKHAPQVEPEGISTELRD
jgi:hypothetical protein